MISELIICPICKHEKVFNYGDKWAINDGFVVSEEKCLCKKKPLLINGKKVLDHAIEIIKLQNEVLNEKSNYRPSKVSKRSRSNSQEQD